MEEKIGKNLYVFLSKCLLSDVWNISISDGFTCVTLHMTLKKITYKFKDRAILSNVTKSK